ncbi:MAG: DUF4136 domain-containing protein [Burkholderiaceae bacterium]
MSIVRSIPLALAAVLLGGCTSLHTVTSTVASFGSWPEGSPPGTYAFDRLPSQQASPQRQEAVEAAAAQALAGAGFRPAPEGTKPAVTVQAGARIERFESDPWADPFWAPGLYHYGWYRPWGPWGPGPYWHRHGGYWGPGPYFPEPDVYEREVALLIRDAATGKPLYEARAESSGASDGGQRLLAAMFVASMRDFPHAIEQPHDVDVDMTLVPPPPVDAVPPAAAPASAPAVRP